MCVEKGRPSSSCANTLTKAHETTEMDPDEDLYEMGIQTENAQDKREWREIITYLTPKNRKIDLKILMPTMKAGTFCYKSCVAENL